MQKTKLTKKKAIWIMIVAVLIVSVAVLVILLAKKPPQGPQPTYYERKLSAFEQENASLLSGQIVFVGDSITDGCVLDEYYAGLPLARYNRGIKGDKSAKLLDRLELSVLDLAPAKIVLMIGVNDVNSNVENSDIISNYNSILSKIKQTLPATDVICVSVLPINHDLDEYTNFDVDKSMQQITELNVEIARVAGEFGYVYVDSSADFADSDGYLKAELSDDGIHPNSAGYAVLSSKIRPYLE